MNKEKNTSASIKLDRYGIKANILDYDGNLMEAVINGDTICYCTMEGSESEVYLIIVSKLTPKRAFAHCMSWDELRKAISCLINDGDFSKTTFMISNREIEYLKSIKAIEIIRKRS